MSKTTGPCCTVAATLGERLPELDAVLRQANHDGFRKLQDRFGVSKSAIERHKQKCLKLATGKGSAVAPKVEGPRGVPEVKKRPKASLGQAGTGVGTPPGSDPPGAARARTHGPLESANLHEDRVLEIVSQMAAGTWDAPKDISRLAGEWRVERDTVRRIAAEASLVCRVDRGTVEERRQASMGWWRRVYEEAMLQAAAPGEYDAASKCLAVAAQAQTGWDKAAGLYDDASKTINIFGDPRFTEAAKRYVDTVQDVLGGAGALADQVRAALGEAVPLEVISAVLAAADDAIAERMKGPQAPALGMGERA